MRVRTADQLRCSDADMARVLEDLIQMLDRRGFINVDALPEPAQAKLERRAELRRRLHPSPPSEEKR